jgi:hypothetical protein
MPYGNLNVDTVTTSTTGGILGAGNASIMKNRIINGAMVIDQRNAGASVTNTAGSIYTLDRWKIYGSVASKFTVQQNAGSVTPPVGFSNYLGFTSSSAYSVGSTDEFDVYQLIEGFNTADLAWGTANAKTITLSFWVRSSLTGTFGGVLYNSGNTRNYPFSYSITSANTWTQISITIAGDTTGTWLTNNGNGLAVLFGLGVGSSLLGTAGAWTTTAVSGATGQISVVGTSGATWYITGVQLEVGSSSTGFEYVNYQTSLANCQRYYQKMSGTSAGGYFGVGLWANATSGQIALRTTNTMRSSPTTSISNVYIYNILGGDASGISISAQVMQTDGGRISWSASTGGTSQLNGGVAFLSPTGSGTSYVDFSAEL